MEVITITSKDQDPARFVSNFTNSIHLTEDYEVGLLKIALPPVENVTQANNRLHITAKGSPSQLVLEIPTGFYATGHDLAQAMYQVLSKHYKEHGQVETIVVSNLANALWRSVDVVIGGQNILQSFDNSYNIGSWFDIVLNTPSYRSPYLLDKEVFLMDEATSKANSEDATIYPEEEAGARPPPANKSALSRGKLIEGGKSVTLISDLNCSLFKTGKLLPSNLDVRLSLTKNYDGYVLLEEAAGTHKLKFDKCFLRVTMQQPTDFCLNLMEQKLLKTPALYQSEEGKVSFHSIPAGNALVTINNLFPQGKLPVMFTFGVQDRAAFGNARNKNPFTFHKIKKVQVYVDGKPHFPSAIQGTTMQFDSFYQTIGYKTTGDCLINPTNYNIHPLFAVDLTADRTGNKHHLNLSRSGEVKLDIEFPAAAVEGLILLVYSYYDRIIEINSDRSLRVL
ncbi:hypothetical protein ACHWQZ_G003665 [Mnemiopsis leidyi]